MPAHYDLLVPSAKSTGVIDVTAPFDGSPIATVDVVDSEAAEQALATAYGLFRDRDAWLSIPQRIAILQKTAHRGRQLE